MTVGWTQRTPVPSDSTDPEQPSAASSPPRRRSMRRDVGLTILVAAVLTLVVENFFLQPYFVPSASMEPTLHGCTGCTNDRILVNKAVYAFRDPHPGDIVVFRAPTGWQFEAALQAPSNPIARGVSDIGQFLGVVPSEDNDLIKRVIAVGGQTVKGDAAGNVYISSHGTAGPYRKLNEPFVLNDGVDSRAAFGPVTVPAGRLWVMGDHRNDSADSRYHCGLNGSDGAYGATCDACAATVPVDNVIGKAALIAWPVSRWSTLGTPPTFGPNTDGDILLIALAAVGVALIGFGSRLVLTHHRPPPRHRRPRSMPPGFPTPH